MPTLLCAEPSNAPTLNCRSLSGGAGKLCESVLRQIQRSSCKDLLDVHALAAMLLPVKAPSLAALVRASRSPSRFMSFMEHDPHELAQLLVSLATSAPLGNGPEASLRFVSTNSNNGFAATIAATYLRRIQHTAFHGLAVHSVKAEWATSHGMRSLLVQSNLTWRGTNERVRVFDAPAEAALMSHSPRTRSPLSHSSLVPAVRFLPEDWHQWPRARSFDLCVRFGAFDQDAIYRDAGMLFHSWCQTIVWHGTLTSNLTFALGLTSPAASMRRAGNFTVIVKYTERSFGPLKSAL